MDRALLSLRHVDVVTPSSSSIEAPDLGSTRSGGLQGHLLLGCAIDAEERTFLAQQSFRAPFHISKPYWNGHALVVQMVNPTAGLFTGDALHCDVRVDAGARLHLTTPSASRVHAMRHGRAVLRQEFRVAAGGWLEYTPGPLIPQRACCYSQRTMLSLEPGGELLWLETVAPGRVAHGERFCFTELDWTSELRLGTKLLARERFRLGPGGSWLEAARRVFPAPYFTSGYLITDRLAPLPGCVEAMQTLSDPDMLLGISQVAASVWSMRMLARDYVAVSRTLARLRQVLSPALPALQSLVRR